MKSGCKVGISILFVLMASNAFAGWLTGPGKADKEKIIVSSTGRKCQQGGFSFQVLNASDYIVNKVSFKVFGTIPGRSTQYDLNRFLEDYVSDAILLPGKDTFWCIHLNESNWPKGQSLAISTEIIEVEFKTSDGVETIN